MRHVVVLDIGKTNAKLALVDAATLQEIQVVTRPNIVLPGPPWPHFDLSGHWDFFLHQLAALQARWGVDAISVTTHGASAVMLDEAGNLAAPMLDYEHEGPDHVATHYDALRPDFAQTGSPRLARGMNLGAQLHWMLSSQPDLHARVAHVLTYPQYWGFRLTGERACDVTSLGCHTDLWNPWRREFSALVDRLGLSGKFAPPLNPAMQLGVVRRDVADLTGLPRHTPVTVGIHDSNASLYPYLGQQTGSFSVISTGTWVVCMAVQGDKVALDPARDVLVNVNAHGQAVPSARFMGGREYDLITAEGTGPVTEADRAAVLAKGIALLPAVEPNFGPFQDRTRRWITPPETPGQRMLALAWYLALMTRTCLDLIGSRGPVIVEGPFARNTDYLDMLGALCPDGVRIAVSVTGTSGGAALLACGPHAALGTEILPAPADATALATYARSWANSVR
jgi:sugar (pentulose or hexulose) kinase